MTYIVSGGALNFTHSLTFTITILFSVLLLTNKDDHRPCGS